MAEIPYDVELNWQGQPFTSNKQGFSFEIRDSIHSFFPTMTLNLIDLTGDFREYLVSAIGMDWEVRYGLDDTYLTCPFIVTDDAMIDKPNEGRIGGGLQMKLVHKMFNQQKLQSKKHNGRISDIIKKIMSNYSVSRINVNDSGNDDEWFQFNKRDSVFILKNLMPYIYSGNSNDSPFYSFIDVNNEFNLLNFKYMFNSSPVADLTFTGSQTTKEVGLDVIYSIEPFRESLSSFYHLQRRKIYYLDKNGVLQKLDDKIEDYPKGSQILPIKTDKSVFTGRIMLEDEEDDRASQDALKGERVQSMKESMLIDKHLIVTPFNPKLRSGKTINITIPEQQSQSPLPNMSGKYLIESSGHSWSGTNGFSRLVVGRKKSNVTNEYSFRSQLLGG